MSNNEIIETSDDEERELFWPLDTPGDIANAQPLVGHHVDIQSPRKRIKIHHDFDSMDLPCNTLRRSSLVFWPPTSSSSPRLVGYSSSPSTTLIPEDDTDISSKDCTEPVTEAMEEDPVDVLPVVLSSPGQVFFSEDEEPPDMQQRTSTPSTLILPLFSSPFQPRSLSADPMSLFDASPRQVQALIVEPATLTHSSISTPQRTPTTPPAILALPLRNGRDPPNPNLFDMSLFKSPNKPSIASDRATPKRTIRRPEDFFSRDSHKTTPPPAPLATPTPDRQHSLSDSARQLTSPLTPLQGLIHSSPRISPPHATPPLTIPEVAPHPASSDRHYADANLNISDTSRYPLRQRKAAQINPYLYDSLNYRNALRGNPDAVVKLRDICRANNDHYDHKDDQSGESQAPWQPGETQDDSDGEQTRRREKSHSRDASRPISSTRQVTGERPVQYPELLRDLSSSDDEETKSMKKFAKEAKWIEKRRRQLQRKQERQYRLAKEESEKKKTRPRAKTFPLKRPHSTSILSDDSPPSQSPDASHDTPLPPASTTSPRTTSPTTPPKSRSSSPVQIVDNVQMDDVDVQPSARISTNNSDAESASRQSSDAEDEDEPLILDNFTKNTIGRMYPTSMLRRIIVASRSSKPKPSNKRRSHTRGSENEETAVLPGHSRTAWSRYTRDDKEIKGDSESSDDQQHSAHDSLSDNDSIAGPSSTLIGRCGAHDVQKAVELSDSDNESEYKGVNDFDIEAYLAGKGVPKKERASSTGQVQERSLIDWMLSGTRTVGGPRKAKTRKRPPDTSYSGNRAGPSSKHNMDLTTHGVRRERQIQLNFDGHKRKPTSRESRARNGAAPSRRTRSDHADAETDHVYDDDVQSTHEVDAPPQKKTRRQKDRERRARAKENGQYVFLSDSTRVISGRRKRPVPTNIEEDDGFLHAIAPLPQDRPQPLQPARIANTNSNNTHPQRTSTTHYPVDMGSAPKQRSWLSDSGIHILRSGLSFCTESYIRKGWLHELVSIVRLETPPPRPVSFNHDDIELGPDTSVHAFSTALKQIFDRLFEIVTSLVGIEDAETEREWLGAQRATTQLLSWHLASASEADTNILTVAIQEQVLTFVSRMRAEPLSVSNLDTFALSICWFAVEISARIDIPSNSTGSSTALTQSVLLLMDYLWQCGLEPVMDSIQNETLPNGPPLARYAAELWVSLFHLLDNLKDQDGSIKKPSHLFSKFVLEMFDTLPLPQNPVKLSECLWHSIFSFCALSQFSVHGMTTSTPRLPASWDIVMYALQQVRLTAQSNESYGLSPEILDHCDKYAQVIIERCFVLWKRWHWQLGEISTVFDRLTKIFQSRNFGGLRHEEPEFPDFLIRNDWDTLEKHEPGEAAYYVLLKLLFQAVGCNANDPQRSLSPKAKKLLSLASSVTKLPYSKKLPTNLQDLSMLFNRLSAIALGIHLDPLNYTQRMSLARSYVDFSNADDTTRNGVIRGMTYLAIVLKNAGLSMNSISTWIEEMASAMANDRRALEDAQPSLPKEEDVRMRSMGRLHICVQLLAGAVRQIFQSYQVDSTNPDPALLKSLDPLFKVTALVDEPTTAQEFKLMLLVFMDARQNVLPPPTRPYRKSVEKDSQESQDEYPTMVIDYDDPELLAALGADGCGLFVPTESTTKDEALSSYMNTPLSSWAWRNLNKKVTDCPSPSKTDYQLFSRWLECWLKCADVAIRTGDSEKIGWKRFLNLKGYLKKFPEATWRRLDVAAMKWILKLDPMQYVEHKELYLENLLMALVSTDPMDERDFISSVLEIDCDQDPLLAGVAIDTDVHDNKEEESAAILQSIINNLAGCVRDRTTSPVDHDSLIDWCIKIYQLMARNIEELVGGSLERRKYIKWCLDIARTVQGQRELYNEPRISSWRGWARERELECA
ncbi:hypothetical protein H0H87_005292 [Tephrocybe sp. NHM501043]|nr:hypothetical protein H0H87_005292 [Tephrocybe sp. NHM501043]